MRIIPAKHADWLQKTSAGSTTLNDRKMMLDPGAPDARAYTVSVIMDIVSRYDVDGIHLDNVRYMGEKAGYGDISVGRFRTQFAKADAPGETDADWKAWRFSWRLGG